MNGVPVNDTIILSLAKLVDDAQKDTREPSHSEIEFQIKKAGLEIFDPNKKDSKPVGKAKRVRTVLNLAINSDVKKAEMLGAGVISLVKSCGGFRSKSSNFVGTEAIINLTDALKEQGVILGEDGSLSPVALDALSGKQLTVALQGYVDRAKKGIEDGALVLGNSKDLMEAVSAHVLQERFGQYSNTVNFPTLLGQAFVALDMATPEHSSKESTTQRCRLEKGMYETACAVNNLRNKQGTGHGRPWLSDLKSSEVRAAIEFIGVLSELMLENLKEKQG